MLSYVFLILFLTAAAVNVIAAKKENDLLFAVTKPMLLPLLCLYCVFFGDTAPDAFLIAALLACWLGDVLLLLRGDVWFAVGGVSFFAGHVLFIVIFARRIAPGGLLLPVLIPAAILYAAAAGAVMFRARKKAPPIMRIPMLLYLLCNSATNLLALSGLTDRPGVWSAVSFAGAALFFTSDCALFLMRYAPEPPRFYKTAFFVMLTYISAVLFITLGLTQGL